MELGPQDSARVHQRCHPEEEGGVQQQQQHLGRRGRCGQEEAGGLPRPAHQGVQGRIGIQQNWKEINEYIKRYGAAFYRRRVYRSRPNRYRR